MKTPRDYTKGSSLIIENPKLETIQKKIEEQPMKKCTESQLLHTNKYGLVGEKPVKFCENTVLTVIGHIKKFAFYFTPSLNLFFQNTAW